MNDAGSLIKKLIEIGKVDSSLARILADKNAIEKSIEDKAAELSAAQSQLKQVEVQFQEKQRSYNKEEKSLSDEKAKLVERRKALTTLSNYKLQQAAEREIEHASRQLTAREEALLQVLQAVEDLESNVTARKEVIEKLEAERASLEEESRGTLSTLEDRRAEKETEREALLEGVSPEDLKEYDRVRRKHPMDPVAAVSGSTCGGCYMNVDPQTVVLVGRGESIVKCRGCGRILFMDKSEESE